MMLQARFCLRLSWRLMRGAHQLPTLASAGVIQLSAHLADEVHAQHPYSTRAPGGPPRMVAWDTKIGGGSAGPRSLRFEQGKLAKLADGSCVVRYGKTTVLCTAVADHTPPAEAQDFMPFQVDYQERLSAAGRLPTTPDRRERSTSDREVLAARLIDRALRPLFPPGFLYNVHVHATVLSADGVCDPDIIALNAASAALMVSDIPWAGPVGALRVGLIDGQFIANPSPAELDASDLNLTFAGTEASVLMLECVGKQVPEDTIAKALQFGQRQVQRLIKVQRQLVAKLPDERTKRRARLTASTAAQRRMVSDVAAPLLDAVFARQLTAKHALTEALQQAKEQAAAELRARGVLVDGGGSSGSSDSAVAMGRAEFDLAWEDVGMASMRQLVLQRDRRADGRGLADLRPVNCEVGVLPIVHGSALFDRGSTQALCVATIGSPTEAPKTRTLLGDTTRTFMLHYSFPPFATNEVGKASGPGRREVGHGNLAERALAPVLPPAELFPWAVRVNAETLGSNGSSSMAAVCGGAMALRNAGVPLRALVAGVSVGLVTERYPQVDGGSIIGGGQLTEPPSTAHPWLPVTLALPPPPPSATRSSKTTDASSLPSSSSSSSPFAQSGSASPSSHSSGSGSSSSGSGGEPCYGRYRLLTDIQGLEDHWGDMDFKVAGSTAGVTALQLDTKLPGLPLDVLVAALQPARAARLRLLSRMDDAIFNCVIPVDAQPVYGSAELPAELVGRFMGEEAENVRRVEAATGARFSVDDTGLVRIFAPSRKQYDAAVEAVKEAEGANILQGLTYRVRVVRLQDYAAFVQLPNGMEHVLHISQLSHTKVRDISEAVAVGDEFDVLCVGRDAKGNALLSRKALLPKPVPPEQQAPPAASAPASSSQPPPAAAEAAAARVSS